MIHVTKNALAVLGRRRPVSAPDIAACDGNPVGIDNSIPMHDVNTGPRVPTCPRCAVLWDEALEAVKP